MKNSSLHVLEIDNSSNTVLVSDYHSIFHLIISPHSRFLANKNIIISPTIYKADQMLNSKKEDL